MLIDCDNAGACVHSAGLPRYLPILLPASTSTRSPTHMLLTAILLGLGTLAPPPADTVSPQVDSVSMIVATSRLDSVMASDSLPPFDVPDTHVGVTGLDRANYRPGPLDFVTNLPGDWIDWTKETIVPENIPYAAAITVATVGLVLVDDDWYVGLRDSYLHDTSFQKASDMAVFIGDGKFQFGIGCLFGLYGFIANDSRAIRTASQTTEVILACGGVVQLLKHLTGRESPYVATSPTGRWALLPNQIEYHKHVPHYDAFPSGHVATALATLTVIMENYPEATWLPWVGYPAIGALAVGMVGAGIHWWSDYPLSIGLGYTFGRLVGSRRSDDRYEGDHASRLPDRSPHFSLSFFSDGSPALGLTWTR